MKFSQMFSSLPKRFAAALLVALAFALPAMSLAAATVQIEGIMGVANVTAGDTSYSTAVSAKYDQVVKYQVYYHNKEEDDSDKVANNLQVKIDLPTQAGKTQKATATVKADNSNTVTTSTTVNLDRSDAYLQYIPGSAVWRHNSGDNKFVDTAISDNVVSGGVRLEDAKPGDANAATVTVLARVTVPGVKIIKQVEKSTETDKWAASTTANPGDRLRYKLTYQNSGNSTQEAVVISDQLPKNVILVPGTTHILGVKDVLDTTNHVASGGLDLGSYEAGAGVSVTFEATLPAAEKLACGDTTFTNIGAAQPKDMQQYFSTATTVVTKKCAPQSSTAPAYSCNSFGFTTGDDRTITVSKFETTAKNGATFKDVVIDWGDDSDVLTTDKAVGKSHTYKKDGAYTVAATAHFTVDGKDKSAPVGPCTKVATFTTAAPAAPSSDENLPDTGAGSVMGLFGVATIIGTLAYRLTLTRRLSR